MSNAAVLLQVPYAGLSGIQGRVCQLAGAKRNGYRKAVQIIGHGDGGDMSNAAVLRRCPMRA